MNNIEQNLLESEQDYNEFLEELIETLRPKPDKMFGYKRPTNQESERIIMQAALELYEKANPEKKVERLSRKKQKIEEEARAQAEYIEEQIVEARKQIKK